MNRYGFPALNGPNGGMKVAYFHSPLREVTTPETVDRRIRDEDITSMREALRRFFPDLDGTFLRGTTCLYSMTPDQHFAIGRHPGHPTFSWPQASAVMDSNSAQSSARSSPTSPATAAPAMKSDSSPWTGSGTLPRRPSDQARPLGPSDSSDILSPRRRRLHQGE